MSKTLRKLAVFILICTIGGIIIPFTFLSGEAAQESKTIKYDESSFIPYTERNGWGITEYADRFSSLNDYFDDKEYIITVRAVDWNMNVLSTELCTVGRHKANEKLSYEMKEIEGYIFDGWYDETGKVSMELSYEFTVRGDKLLTARYITEPVVTIMYSTTRLNVRMLPDIESEIVATVPMNYEFNVYDYDKHHIWDMVEYEGARYYVNTEYLSETKTITAVSSVAAASGTTRNWLTADHFCYYGIWCGAYYHFTPEQWDAKKGLPIGTTRAWQKYLWDKLAERGIEWWYKIACAQAMQESGWNPLNTASVDHGLFSFRIWYWRAEKYGDVCDYHANINAYVDRVSQYVINCKNGHDIDMALSQHYIGSYTYMETYCNHVYSRLPYLWEME